MDMQTVDHYRAHKPRIIDSIKANRTKFDKIVSHTKAAKKIVRNPFLEEFRHSDSEENETKESQRE